MLLGSLWVCLAPGPGCVELVLINTLGDFKKEVINGLHESWTFPSDHPPIACQILECQGTPVTLNVASWNVLNQHYLKWIIKDTQGLDRSALATCSELSSFCFSAG